MPPVAAVVGGIGSLIGGAAAGAAGLAAGAASAIGSVASGILGGATGLAGGAASLIGSGISALTGGAAASQAAVPVMVGGEMGSLAAASLGVPAATAGVSTGLSTIFTGVQAGVGIYGQLSQIEAAKEMTEAQKITAQTKLMEAEALKIYAAAPATVQPATSRTAVPTLSQQPVYVTPAAAPAGPSYMIYIGLAILAFLVLGKKIK